MLMRITPPQRRRWTGWRRSSKPPFLLRFYYFSTPSEAPKCHDMRGIFRNAKCRKCLIFQAIPTFAKWCQDNQKIGRTFCINDPLSDDTWENTEYMWLINGHKFSYVHEWTETTASNIGMFITQVRINLTHYDNEDDTHSYSVGFFTAEDTENKEIYVVVILQRIVKSSAAAPVA